jgi:hypothetical protein
LAVRTSKPARILRLARRYLADKRLSQVELRKPVQAYLVVPNLKQVERANLARLFSGAQSQPRLLPRLHLVSSAAQLEANL